jgi:hypothetical protein
MGLVVAPVRCSHQRLVPRAALRATRQSRLLLDSEKVELFANLMKEGQEFPPVQVSEDGEVYQLWDGYHRQQASCRCSFTHIPVEFIRMPVLEPPRA